MIPTARRKQLQVYLGKSPHSEQANPPAVVMEILIPPASRSEIRVALFDFDGTLSLLRRNWQEVMIPMMVDELQRVSPGEEAESLCELVTDFVTRLTGKQTIYQMMRLQEEVQRRGGDSRTALEYKHRYHDLLWDQVKRRIESVRSGRISADEMTVPGSRLLLEQLVARNVRLYLASGTDIEFVRSELDVLGMTSFFEERVYGALDDYKRFSKAMVIQQIFRDTGVPCDQLIGFGDGYVEIEEVRKVGGFAVGVASNETNREGIDPWKRDRLIQAGANAIVADYRDLPPILDLL